MGYMKSVYYEGPEIVSILKRKKNGKIIKGQHVDVKCSTCNTIIKNVGYINFVYKRVTLNLPYRCKRCIYESSSDGLYKWNQEKNHLPYEEKYGQKKADDLKSQKRKYAIEHNTSKHLPNNIGKTYEELYGNERAKILKNAARERAIAGITFKPRYGKDNGQFGKPANKLSGKGCKCIYNGIFFRSILELSFYINFIQKYNLNWQSGELKQNAIPYIFHGTKRNYFPDYIIGNIVYEIKPKSLINTDQNRSKFYAARKHCKMQNKLFQIITENDIKRVPQKYIDILIDQNKLHIHENKYNRDRKCRKNYIN